LGQLFLVQIFRRRQQAQVRPANSGVNLIATNIIHDKLAFS
jgi:hypothetical protein